MMSMSEDNTDTIADVSNTIDGSIQKFSYEIDSFTSEVQTSSSGTNPINNYPLSPSPALSASSCLSSNSSCFPPSILSQPNSPSSSRPVSPFLINPTPHSSPHPSAPSSPHPTDHSNLPLTSPSSSYQPNDSKNSLASPSSQQSEFLSHLAAASSQFVPSNFSYLTKNLNSWQPSCDSASPDSNMHCAAFDIAKSSYTSPTSLSNTQDDDKRSMPSDRLKNYSKRSRLMTLKESEQMAKSAPFRSNESDSSSSSNKEDDHTLTKISIVKKKRNRKITSTRLHKKYDKIKKKDISSSSDSSSSSEQFRNSLSNNERLKKLYSTHKRDNNFVMMSQSSQEDDREEKSVNSLSNPSSFSCHFLNNRENLLKQSKSVDYKQQSSPETPRLPSYSKGSSRTWPNSPQSYSLDLTWNSSDNYVSSTCHESNLMQTINTDIYHISAVHETNKNSNTKVKNEKFDLEDCLDSQPISSHLKKSPPKYPYSSADVNFDSTFSLPGTSGIKSSITNDNSNSLLDINLKSEPSYSGDFIMNELSKIKSDTLSKNKSSENSVHKVIPEVVDVDDCPPPCVDLTNEEDDEVQVVTLDQPAIVFLGTEPSVFFSQRKRKSKKTTHSDSNFSAPISANDTIILGDSGNSPSSAIMITDSQRLSDNSSQLTLSDDNSERPLNLHRYIRSRNPEVFGDLYSTALNHENHRSYDAPSLTVSQPSVNAGGNIDLDVLVEAHRQNNTPASREPVLPLDILDDIGSLIRETETRPRTCKNIMQGSMQRRINSIIESIDLSTALNVAGPSFTGACNKIQLGNFSKSSISSMDQNRPSTSTQQESETSNDDNMSCPICFESFQAIKKAGKFITSTTCGHIFCLDCLEASLKTRKMCPTCRKKISKRQYHPLYLPG